MLATTAKLKPVAMNESAAGKSTATAPRRSLASSLNPFVWQMKSLVEKRIENPVIIYRTHSPFPDSNFQQVIHLKT